MAKFSDNSKDGGKNGGGKPPAKREEFLEVTEPRCSVCQSAYRRDIDRLLALGFSGGRIAEFFERMGENFTRKAIWNHGRKHMTLHTSAVRGIIEDKARKQFEDIDEVKGFLLTKESLVEIATHQGFLAMMQEKMDWTPKDLLAWMEKMEAMEREQYDESLHALQMQFDALVQAVKSMVPTDLWPKIYERWDVLLEVQTPRMPQLTEGEIIVFPDEIEETE